MRIGIGYDIHRLKKGRSLWLGGIRIEHSKGLDGHSDADALLHAVIDAILGAAALPDIGHFFPPGDPATKDISSAVMLQRVMKEIIKEGYIVGNVDCNVIAEEPKLKPHREAIRKNMARMLNVSVKNISVKGKTNEGLDAVGRGQAIAVQAVVLLK